MAKITASLSSKVDGRGKSEILLRFVAGRDHIYRLHSRISVQPSRFKDGSVVIPRIATEEQQSLRRVREQLDALCARLLDEYESAPRGEVSREWMQDAVERFHNPAGTSAKGFFEAFEAFEDAKRGEVSTARMNRYGVTVRALGRWEQVRRRKLSLARFSKEDVQAFEKFLLDEHTLVDDERYADIYGGMGPKELPGMRSRNTLLDYTGVIRAFFHWARSEKLTQADPFEDYTVAAAVYGTPYFISVDELERIRTCDLEKRPEIAAQRDIFVFQCLVGCRVGDLRRFRKGDIVDGVLEYIPHKTKDGKPRTVRVPLNSRAREIVERYAGFRGDRLLPFISPQKYNEDIKKVFKAAGVTRKVAVLDPLTREEVREPLDEIASSHLARRTFIGNLYRQVKDPNLIGSMSGHAESSRAFARYRDIDDSMKADIVRLLETGGQEKDGEVKDAEGDGK